MPERQWSIYVLKDPRMDEVFYVGRTKNPKMRLAAHISDGIKANRRNTPKNNRIRKLIAAGFTPVLEVVESGFGDSAEAECRWIAAMRADGIKLLNSTDGGEGVRGLKRGPWTVEHTANYTAAMQKVWTTPAYRARLSAALTGYKRSPEHCQNLARALTGKKLPPETRARISAAMKNNRNGKTTKNITEPLD